MEQQYDVSKLLVEFAKNAGVTKDMSLIEVLQKILTKAQPLMEATHSAITLFEKLGKGKTYECPTCKSATLLEFGHCHVCEQELFVDKLNVVTAKPTPVAEVLPAPNAPAKETKTKKQKTTEVKTATVEKKDPKSLTKDDLESLLAKAKDNKNKSEGLKLIADAAGIKLPKPDSMTTSAIRTEVVNGLEALIKKLPTAKVVEADEDEVLADEDTNELVLDDEDDNGDDVVESSDDEEEIIEPQNPKKIGSDKKSNKKVEVELDEDDELVLEDDEDEEKPSTKKTDKKETSKKKDKKSDKKNKVEDSDEELEDDPTFSLEDEDLELDNIEVDDDETVISDDDDIED